MTKLKKILVGVGVLIGIIAVVVGTMFATGTISMLTAPFRGAVEAEEQIQSGTNRIAAYDEFYDVCASVQADEDRLDNLRAEREDADASRASQLDATITAVENSRAEKIRGYNADARKEYTDGQFRSSDLPYQLDVKEEETECEA